MSHPPVSMGEEILALVRVPSVTGTEGALAGLLEARLRGGPAGRVHRVFRIGDSLLLVPATLAPLADRAEATGGPGAEAGLDPPLEVPGGGTAGSRSPEPLLIDGRPLLVLAGHIDTVPRGDSPEPSLRDGRVAGRGACDMKAGVAVMLRLAETLDPSDGFAHRAFIFYAGEEGPGVRNGLKAILAAHPWLRRAGLALLIEPTSGDLELGCSGSIQLAVTFHGTACHSARPWTGVHPLRHALPWLEEILARPIREARIAGVVFREVVTPTVLRAGEARNVVPGALEVNVNLRYPPDRTAEQAEELARSFFPAGTVFRGFARPLEPDDAAVVEDARPGGITVELFSHSPAGAISSDTPFYRHLLDSTGLPRRAKQAWTDVARFSSLGVAALNWGPGDPELCHTREEFVEVAEAERFFSRIRAYLLGAGPQP